MPIANCAIASLRPLEHHNLPRPGRFLLNRAQARRRGGGEDGLRGMHVEAEAGAGEPHDKVHHLLTCAHVPRAGRETQGHEAARVPRGGGDEPGHVTIATNNHPHIHDKALGQIVGRMLGLKHLGLYTHVS